MGAVECMTLATGDSAIPSTYAEVKEAGGWRGKICGVQQNKPHEFRAGRHDPCPAGCCKGDDPVKFKHCKTHYGKVR